MKTLFINALVGAAMYMLANVLGALVHVGADMAVTSDMALIIGILALSVFLFAGCCVLGYVSSLMRRTLESSLQ